MAYGRQELVPLSEMLSFKGKTVLVTGAASGIGRAITRRFDEGEADLILLDINQEGLEKTRDGLKRAEAHSTYRVDLSSENEINQFWNNLQILPDILINNAGIYPEQNFLELDTQGFDKTFRVNFGSALWMCKNFIKLRGKAGGTIVNVSSIEAFLPFKKNMLPYSVAKGAVNTLSRCLVDECRGKEFKINTIIPGAIKTPGTKTMALKAITNLRFDLVGTGIKFVQRLPKRRFGGPDEVAKPVLFFSSDLSSYVQGASLPVDGGFLSN